MPVGSMKVQLAALLPVTGDGDSGQCHLLNHLEVSSANIGGGWKSATQFISSL
jgi:hypothetical protein